MDLKSTLHFWSNTKKIKLIAGLGAEICHSEVDEVLNNWKALNFSSFKAPDFIQIFKFEILGVENMLSG